MATNKRTSPYGDVSDRLWDKAYQEACDRIFAHENGSEREPEESEIDHALGVILENQEEDI